MIAHAAGSGELLSVACMCGATLKVPASLDGSRVKCKRCGAMARVTASAKAPPQNRSSWPRGSDRTKEKKTGNAAGGWLWRVMPLVVASAIVAGVSYDANSNSSSNDEAITPLINLSDVVSEATPGVSPGTSYGDRSADLGAERARVQAMESGIRSLDLTLDLQKNELESMASRLRSMEGGYSGASEDEYEMLRMRYNRDVDDYNMSVQRRSSSYQDYSSSLDNFNSRVDSYNADRH
jgi:hypothetical protein